MPADRILLIRHAQSQWNAEGRWQGQQGPGLSALGHRQAEAGADGDNGDAGVPGRDDAVGRIIDDEGAFREYVGDSSRPCQGGADHAGAVRRIRAEAAEGEVALDAAAPQLEAGG